MYLSRMALNSQRRQAKTLLASPQALHAAVLAGFADAEAWDDGRVLWRLDTYPSRKTLLYVASPRKPDFTHLVEQAGWPTTETWDTRDYKVLLGDLRAGQRWQFRLTANPVKSVRLPGWANTKPVGHVTVRQQLEWLTDRADRLGFRLPPSSVGGAEEPDVAVVDRSIKQFARQKRQVTISTATFEGHLEVVDPSALRQALTHGIGRAKAYGCGMLTLAPAKARA
jgi:CRISPR system Cascade subunit CasE